MCLGDHLHPPSALLSLWGARGSGWAPLWTFFSPVPLFSLELEHVVLISLLRISVHDEYVLNFVKFFFFM